MQVHIHAAVTGWVGCSGTEAREKGVEGEEVRCASKAFSSPAYDSAAPVCMCMCGREMF